ncbi:recombination regulator RecX [Streptococcus hongkongensis]|nr:recombination regulator RecX [Streptococcus uberis]
MKISKIEKKKRLYLLELDDSEKMYVTEDTIVHFMLSKGMSISPEELKSMKAFAHYSHGKNLALYHLSFQVRTKDEVKKYLEKHAIESPIIEQVLKDLETDKWIDDCKYVETYIRQNASNGDKGPMVLKQKLIQKGISGGLIDQELQKTDFSKIAKKIAHKIISKQEGKLPPKALKDKLTQQMVTKGFSFDQIKTITSTIDFNNYDDNTSNLLEKEMDKAYRNYSRKYEGYALKQRLFQALYRKGFDSDDITRELRNYL